MMRGMIFAFVMFLSLPAMAQEKLLRVELAEQQVDITTGFNGTNVVLFGTKTMADAGLVVTLKGPERKMIVRRKGKVAGTWMNNNSIEFRRVPSYYDYSTSIADEVLEAAPQLMNDNQIGVDHLAFYPEDEEKPEVLETFSDALIRQMQGKGFYPLGAGDLTLLDDHFFKVTFELPPGVPTGIYTAEALLIKDGIVLAKESRTLQVGQVGFNARVYRFAENHAVFYGLLAVFIAAFAGWSAFTFLRRD